MARERTEEERERLLQYRFLSLFYLQRIKIALDLNLLQNHDEGVTAEESFTRWLQRAKERNELAQLERATDQWHTQISPVGPFKR